MMPSQIDQSLARAGHIVLLGSLVHPKPWFPGRSERAALIARALPPWAIASGITAGWVWTGMGHPEPWSVLREEKPGLSPLERTTWRARLRVQHHRVTSLGALRLLTPQSSIGEILGSAESVDVCASQILLLSAHQHTALGSLDLAPGEAQPRASAAQRAHASAVLTRVSHLHVHYPDITR